MACAQGFAQFLSAEVSTWKVKGECSVLPPSGSMDAYKPACTPRSLEVQVEAWPRNSSPSDDGMSLRVD